MKRLVDKNRKVVATWILLTNVPKEVKASTIIGTWYYHRWKEDKNAPAVRKFLVQLSARLIEKGKEYTTPALLAGLWVFMKMMNVLNIYDVEALFAFREQIGDMMGMEI